MKTMLMRYCSLIVLVFLFSGCAHHGSKIPVSQVQSAGVKISQYRNVTAFNQVDVTGLVNVNLHTGYKQPQVILKGDSRDLAQVKTVVTQNTLYLVIGKGFPQYGPVSADIRGRFLNRFNYIGAGTITGTQLHTSLLDLSIVNDGRTTLGGTIGLRQLNLGGNGFTQINGISNQNLKINLKGNPKVQLTGFTNLTNLDLDGGGWLSMYWVKSDTLTIRSRQAARIQLAGIVNRLEVELWGNSNFKGRYLRAQRTFIKTHGKSVAEISSVNHQSSLATDASDIYYYNLPNTRADFMAFNGSVLDMREWAQPDLKDFTRYNKQFP